MTWSFRGVFFLAFFLLVFSLQKLIELQFKEIVFVTAVLAALSGFCLLVGLFKKESVY